MEIRIRNMYKNPLNIKGIGNKGQKLNVGWKPKSRRTEVSSSLSVIPINVMRAFMATPEHSVDPTTQSLMEFKFQP
jgi:hypothetical protein